MKTPISHSTPREGGRARFRASTWALALVLSGAATSAQVITVDTSHGNATTLGGASVDRRYAQIQPTHVQLQYVALGPKSRLELERLLQSEQGFAMRPFPKGHKGLTLEANGKLDPAGEAYVSMVTAQGLCARPGDRIVITDLKFDKNKIEFMINGGPDAKHRFLRHIQIGTGSSMGPVVQDDGQDPQGARLTLTFKSGVPELTGKDVKALLAPLISFDMKTPIQAFTDTLPPKLKDAILNHHVMVGMTTDMVVFALGAPDRKIREMDGQMPFEEWIYGAPPKAVQFVRINGNRVIRLEIADVGKAPQVFEKDEVEGLMRTDGSPLAPDTHTRTVAIGDVQRDPNTQAPDAPPTLRKEGETLPQDDPRNTTSGEMKPVQFPKQKSDDYPDASRLPRSPAPEDGTDKPVDKTGEQPASKPADKPADKPANSQSPAPPPAQPADPNPPTER